MGEFKRVESTMEIKRVQLPKIVFNYVEAHYGEFVAGTWEKADFIRIWDEYLKLSIPNHSQELADWFNLDSNLELWVRAIAFDFYSESESKQTKEVSIPNVPSYVSTVLCKMMLEGTSKASFIKRWDEYFAKESSDFQEWVRNNKNFLFFVQALWSGKFTVELEVDLEPAEHYFHPIELSKKRQSKKKNRELSKSFKMMAGSLDEAEAGIAEMFYKVAEYLPIDVLLMLIEEVNEVDLGARNGINYGMEETYLEGQKIYESLLEEYKINPVEIINNKRFW